MTTDNTQELDEILSKAEGSCTYDCRNFCSHPLSNRKGVKQSLLDWHNKQVVAVLDKEHSVCCRK